MRITENIYMVGSGSYGISHPDDANVWLIASGAGAGAGAGAGEGTGAEVGSDDKHLALVDSGSGADTEAILANVEKEGFDPQNIEYLLLTHAHRDHAGGCAGIKAAIPGCTLLTSAVEADLLESGDREALGLDLLGFGEADRSETLPPCTVDIRLAHLQSVQLGEIGITAAVVPGHNPGCVCYVAEIGLHRALFAGDTVFCGGYISVGNWPGSSTKSYQETIGRLSGLEIDMLFSGHHVFALAGGQDHIDKAVAAFSGLWPPPQIHTIL